MQNMRLSQEQKSRLYALDGLRGIFAFGVMLYHFSVWGEFVLSDYTHDILTKFSLFGVVGFFVISGYSMYYSYEARMNDWLDIKHYMLRRILRIAPLFWLVCTIYLVLRIVIGSQGIEDVWALLMNYLYNITFLFGVVDAGEESMAVGGWSIGIEWMFYILFPAIVFLLRTSFKSKLLCLAVSVLYYFWYVNAYLDYSKDPAAIFYSFARIDVLAAYFIVGCVAASCHSMLSKLFMKRVVYGLGILAIAIMAFVPLHGTIDMDAFRGLKGGLFFLATVLIVILAAWVEGMPVLIKQIMEFLGRISYALYLTHFLVFNALGYTSLSGMQQALVSVVATICLAYLSYRFFEQPIFKLFRK